MKIRLFAIVFFSALALCASAQTNAPDTSLQLAVRQGTKYAVGNAVMSKRAFQGFLQSRNAVSYKYFSSGRTLSNVGWGLFGGGLGLTAAGVPLLVCSLESFEVKSTGTNNPAADLVAAPMLSMMTLAVGAVFLSIPLAVGITLTVASIPMLGVGYHRMDKAVDIYNNDIINRTKQPAVSLSLKSSADGVGLALSF